MAVTKLTDLVDPEVLADMVSGKVEKHIRITPFAAVDNTLVGRPGSTITVPFYGHIGAAVVVAEGDPIPTEKLSTTTKDYKVEKLGKGVEITDEAVLSGYGDPIGQASTQLAQAIAQSIDQKGIDALMTGTQHFFATTGIKYEAIVDGIDVFQEEINTPKVMFIHPAQVKALRKDANFISADKYGIGTNVVMYGEVGMIANTRIVPTKRVVKNAELYYKVAQGTSGAKEVVASGASGSQVNLETVKAKAISGYTPTVGDYVMNVAADTFYVNPIVRLSQEDEADTGIPAITIYLKRDTFVEPSRDAEHKQTAFYADKHSVVALTNDANVCLLYVNA